MAVRYLSMSDVRYPHPENRRRVELNERSLAHSFAAAQRTSVFLSHKHNEDPTILENVKAIFLSLGESLYIDWQDESMPPVTNAETAKRLIEAINNHKRFVVLATPASISSIWIPWEIGLADRLKTTENMAMLPILDSSETWEKREYCRLYDRIVQVDGVWSVMKPEYQATRSCTLLQWLKK